MSSSSVALSSPAKATVAQRIRSIVGLHPAVVAAAIVGVIAWGGLLLTHRATPLAVPKAAALHAVLRNPGTAKLLSSLHWTRYDVSPMDSQYEILGFYRGGRMVANVTVGYRRRVVILNVTNLARLSYVFGANIANDPRVLGALAAVFVLMTAVWPLWRLRNLDVLAIASLALPVVLFNDGRLTAMVLVVYPVLIYLAFRCGWWAFGAPRENAPPAISLYLHLTRSWRATERVRVLRFVLFALALIVAMVGLTSPNVMDVGYAVMEGATKLVHGALPYGHIPDVLHGDTYPLGSYLLYVPLALFWPVRTVWDDADPTLVVAVLAALLTAAGSWRMLARGRRRSDRPAQTAALQTATAILAFPPLLVTVSTGTTDVVLGAMMVAVLLLWRRPGWALTALSGAVWFKAAPAALVPLMLARLRGRSIGYGIVALLLTSTLMGTVLIGLGGLDAPGRMLSAIGFQFTRASPHTLWAITGSVPLQQLAEAGTIALIVGGAVRLYRDPALADERARLAAIAAAVLLGVQVAANYWQYMYLVWVLPLIALSLLADEPADDPTG